MTPLELAEKIQWHCDEITDLADSDELVDCLAGFGLPLGRSVLSKLHNAHLSLSSAARDIIHGLEDH
jgi:hypothetical protein